MFIWIILFFPFLSLKNRFSLSISIRSQLSDHQNLLICGIMSGLRKLICLPLLVLLPLPLLNKERIEVIGILPPEKCLSRSLWWHFRYILKCKESLIFNSQNVQTWCMESVLTTNLKNFEYENRYLLTRKNISTITYYNALYRYLAL